MESAVIGTIPPSRSTASLATCRPRSALAAFASMPNTATARAGPAPACRDSGRKYSAAPTIATKMPAACSGSPRSVRRTEDHAKTATGVAVSTRLTAADGSVSSATYWAPCVTA